MNFLYIRFLAIGAIFLCIASSCINTSHVNTGFNWLLGDWERINNEGKEKTFENWIKLNDTLYTGFGFTLSEVDTVFKENLSLFKLDKAWIFQVDGVNETPVDFILQQTLERGFIAINEQNPFPKSIFYQLKEDENLQAVIANEEKEILFVFQKNKKP